jgi:hypothetical protein
MTERKQKQQKENTLITKSIFMTIAWLNFYAINWYMLYISQENAVVHVFMWVVFAVLAVVSSNYREPKDE